MFKSENERIAVLAEVARRAAESRRDESGESEEQANDGE